MSVQQKEASVCTAVHLMLVAPPLALSEILLLHLDGTASVYRRDDVPGAAGKAGRNTDGCRRGAVKWEHP